MFSTRVALYCRVVFSYGDYMRCGAIARFAPVMQQCDRIRPKKAEKCWVLVMVSRSCAECIYYPAPYYQLPINNLFARTFTSKA